VVLFKSTSKQVKNNAAICLLGSDAAFLLFGLKGCFADLHKSLAWGKVSFSLLFLVSMPAEWTKKAFILSGLCCDLIWDLGVFLFPDWGLKCSSVLARSVYDAILPPAVGYYYKLLIYCSTWSYLSVVKIKIYVVERSLHNIFFRLSKIFKCY